MSNVRALSPADRIGREAGHARRRAWSLALSLGLSLLAPDMARAGGALPSGGQFSAGAGAIAATNTGLAISQSTSRGIINWQNFSIGQGLTVQFNNGAGATLNRVTGNSLSTIAGALTATGSVYLVNPRGVIITPTGQVLTNGSFLASTRNIGDDAFMQGGALRFQGNSPGGIVNQGSIVSTNGDVVLIGQSVRNDGQIGAANGTAGLAAGDDVLLQPANGDQRIFIAAGSGNVTNTGTIAAAQAELTAAGGNVYALAGNNGGLVRATGTATVNGHVWLTAGGNVNVAGTLAARNADGAGGTIAIAGGAASGTVAVTGTVDASAQAATRTGGLVTMTAATVNLANTATVAANGGSDGGAILIGGDRHGGEDAALDLSPTAIADAQQTIVAAGARISADGGSGNGGSVVVWSDQETNFAGAITARGGGGNGGFAEVSSAQLLGFTGAVNLVAANGLTGTLLLDPANVTINTSTTTNDTLSGGTLSPTSGAATSTIKNTDLDTDLASSSIVITTTNNGTAGGSAGNIVVGAPITWASANSLTLSAANNISFSGTADTISAAGSGGITLTSAGGSISVGAAITTASGNISLAGTVIAIPAAINSGGSLNLTASTGTITQSAALTAAGPSSFTTVATNKVITLTNAGNALVGAVSLSATGNASLTNDAAGGTMLAASTVGGTLTVVNTQGNLSQTGALGVTGPSSFTDSAAGATIVLTNPANSFTGAVALHTNGAGSDASLTNNVATALAASGVGGNLTVMDATGNLTQTGVLTVTGTSSFTTSATDATITLTSANLLTGAVALDTSGTGNASLTNDLAGGLVLGASSVGGTLTVKSTLGPLTQTGALTVGGTSSFTASAAGAAITLTNPSNALTGAITLSTNAADASLANNVATALAASSVGGNLVVDATGSLTQTGVLTVAGTSTFTTAASNATITLGSANKLTGAVSLNTDGTNGNASLTNNLATVLAASSVGGSLTVTASTGGLSQTGAQTAGGAVTLTADTIALTQDVTGQTVTIAPKTANTALNLGTGSTGLMLSQAELDEITATTLVFGSATATGAMMVGTAAAPGTVTNLTLETAGKITVITALADGNAGASVTLATKAAPTLTGLVQATGTGGTVVLAPLTASSTLGLGTGAGTLVLSNAALGQITAANVVFGGGTATGAMTVGGAVSTPTTVTDLTLETAGAITINAAASITDSHASGILTLATGTAFDNLGGAHALAATGGGGRWLVYSATPASNAIDGLSFGFVQYATSFPAAPTPASGNGFLYTLAPTLTVSLTGTVSKVYDGTAAAILATGNYAIAGIVGADSVTLNDPAGGTYDTQNVGTGKTVSASGLAITAAVNGAATVFGYTLSSTSAVGAIGTITPATLAITGVTANNKAYDKTNIATLSGTAALSGVISGDIVMQSGTPAAMFASVNVANNIAVTVTGYTLVGASAGNYVLSQPAGLAANITPAMLTITGVAANDKVYDKTNTATLGGTAVLSGVISGDTVVLGGVPAAMFASVNVAGNIAVTVSGYTIGGAAAGNYTLTQPAGLTASITPAMLTIAASSDSKIYDGTASSSQTPTSVGLQPGDSLAALTQAFASKNVLGVNGSTLNVTSYTVNDGNGGQNYTVTLMPTLGTITPAALTLTATANTKIYDGTTSAAAVPTVTSGTLYDPAILSESYASANAGAGLTLIPMAVINDGNGGNNYTVSPVASAAGVITPATLTYTANAVSQSYGTAIPSFSGTVTGFVGSDTTGNATSGTLSFITAATPASNVGRYAITGAGLTANNGNYVFAQAAGNETALTINPATLTITGVTANDKVYDRANSATLSGSAALSGVIVGDIVTLGGTPAAIFASANVASNIAVTVTGFTIGGAAAGNYTLTQPAGLTASITPAALTITGLTANNKVYDGTSAATLSGTAALSGVIAGDMVTLGGTPAAAFASPDAAANIAVTVTGYTIGGASVGNYTLTQPMGLTANIVPATLMTTGVTASVTVIGVTANNKVYDGTNIATLSGTAALAGVISGDTVSLGGTPAAIFASVNVGNHIAVTVTGYTIGGASAGNYILTQPTGLIADITPAVLTIAGLTANNKVYDKTNAATLNGTASLSGVIAGDAVTLGGTPAAIFAGVNAATGVGVTVTGFTLGGASAGNYTLAPPTGLAANITPAALTIAGVTANSKIYDKTNAATLSGTAVLSGAVSGDAVTLGGTPAAAFASVNVANGIAVVVTGYTIGGAAAANYTLTPATTLAANITPATLTEIANPASITIGATLPAFSGTVTGFVTGDSQPTATTGTLSFATAATSASPAGSYAITGSGLAANNGNYVFVQAMGNATAFTIMSGPAIGSGPVNVPAWSMGPASPTINPASPTVNVASPTVNAAALTFVALTTPRGPVVAAAVTTEATAAALNQIAPAAGGTPDDGATFGPFETRPLEINDAGMAALVPDLSPSGAVRDSDAITATIAQSLIGTPVTPPRRRRFATSQGVPPADDTYSSWGNEGLWQ